MTKKQCRNCQYFRDGDWCSDSKSPMFYRNITSWDGCAEYSRRGKKAPLWMRVAVEATRLAEQLMRKVSK